MIVGRTMWTQCTSVTDGQTDGQTNRRTDRITVTKTVQRRASQGKNCTKLFLSERCQISTNCEIFGTTMVKTIGGSACILTYVPTHITGIWKDCGLQTAIFDAYLLHSTALRLLGAEAMHIDLRCDDVCKQSWISSRCTLGGVTVGPRVGPWDRSDAGSWRCRFILRRTGFSGVTRIHFSTYGAKKSTVAAQLISVCIRSCTVPSNIQGGQKSEP